MDELRKVDARVRRIPLTRKYRYIFVQAPRPIKAKIVAALEPFLRPYPTRASENVEPMNIAGMIDQRSFLAESPGQRQHYFNESSGRRANG
jgi:hypothetical protein